MKSARTIYLVDDDSLMVKLYSSILQTYSFKILAFQDPRVGLEQTLSTPPDLLLLDLKMPFMDGFEFLSRIKADPKTKELPVIVLTNLSGPDERKKVEDLDVSDFVVKSDTSPEELVERIRRILN